MVDILKISLGHGCYSFIVTFSSKASAFNCFDLCFIVSKLKLTEPVKILLVYSFVQVACCILSKYTRSQVGHLISKKGPGCLLYVHVVSLI